MVKKWFKIAKFLKYWTTFVGCSGPKVEDQRPKQRLQCLFTLALHADKPSVWSVCWPLPITGPILLDPRDGLEHRFKNPVAIQCLSNWITLPKICIYHLVDFLLSKAFLVVYTTWPCWHDDIPVIIIIFRKCSYRASVL